MQRVSDIVGKPIVSSDSGRRVGRVADLLVDHDGTRVIGVVVRDGVLAPERVLLYKDVQAIGADAVVARSDMGVMGRKEWRDRGAPAARSSALRDKRVVTDKGRKLGTIKDVYIDEQTGIVEGYDVASGGFAGLRERHAMLSRTGGVTVGRDVVIVPDNAAAMLEAEQREDRPHRPDA